MMRFEVVDFSVDGRLALLLDDDRREHVVRLPTGGLVRGALLSGRRAKLGDHVLVLAQGKGVTLHAQFESVACSQDQALALMHPVSERPGGVLVGAAQPKKAVPHEAA